MDRWNKVENIVGASLFGAIGIVCLVAALFFGATHQFAMAAICAVMVAAAITEIRREEKRAKEHQSSKIQ